jgi:hypothetical protein
MGQMNTSMVIKPLFSTDIAVASVQPITTTTPVTTTAITIITDDQIDKIGEANKVTASGFSSKMLTSVKASDVDVMGGKLNELIGVAKGLDPTKFAKGGVLSKLTSLFGNVKEKMLSEYQSVEKRMDTLVSEIDKTALTQHNRITDLEDMYNLNVRVHDGFQADIDTIKTFLVSLNAQIEQEKSVVNPDSFVAQRVSDIQGRIDRSEKKTDDLERAKLLCKQLAPQIRIMQSNARSLVQKFGDVKTITIPAWKNVFTLYIVNIEQKKGAALAAARYDPAIDTILHKMFQGKPRTILFFKPRLIVMQSQLVAMLPGVQKYLDEATNLQHLLTLNVASLSGVCEASGAINDPTLEHTAHDRRTLLTQSANQAKLIQLQLKQTLTLISDQLSRCNQMINVTIPAFEMANASK